MEKFLLGYSIASTIIALFAIWMLYKKQSTTNNIEDQTIKNKRNKASNLDNNINIDKAQERRRLFNKNKKL